MAGGAQMAGMTDPDRIWTEAAGRLRSEIGEGAFSSYIAPSAVRADGAGQLILATPTAYARDWVRKNALRHVQPPVYKFHQPTPFERPGSRTTSPVRCGWAPPGWGHALDQTSHADAKQVPRRVHPCGWKCVRAPNLRRDRRASTLIRIAICS